MLEIVASHVHLRRKYHNLHGEPAVSHFDLETDKKIHHALLRDLGGGTTMEINMAFLIWELRSLNLYTSRRG